VATVNSVAAATIDRGFVNTEGNPMVRKTLTVARISLVENRQAVGQKNESLVSSRTAVSQCASYCVFGFVKVAKTFTMSTATPTRK
jgi:hypothetical protein